MRRRCKGRASGASHSCPHPSPIGSIVNPSPLPQVIVDALDPL